MIPRSACNSFIDTPKPHRARESGFLKVKYPGRIFLPFCLDSCRIGPNTSMVGPAWTTILVFYDLPIF